MTSYTPKYQFAAISARRASKAEHRFVEYQQLLKSGKWGAVRRFEMRKNSHLVDGKWVYEWEAAEQALARFAAMNPQYTLRLAQ